MIDECLQSTVSLLYPVSHDSETEWLEGAGRGIPGDLSHHCFALGSVLNAEGVDLSEGISHNAILIA